MLAEVNDRVFNGALYHYQKEFYRKHPRGSSFTRATADQREVFRMTVRGWHDSGDLDTVLLSAGSTFDLTVAELDVKVRTYAPGLCEPSPTARTTMRDWFFKQSQTCRLSSAVLTYCDEPLLFIGGSDAFSEEMWCALLCDQDTLEPRYWAGGGGVNW